MQLLNQCPALLLAAGLLLTACNSSSGEAPGSAPSASPAAKTTAASVTSAASPSAAAPDFSPWDLRAIRAALVGSYVFKFNGTYQAWDIRADDATLSGDILGKAGEDTVATVELIAPCRLSVKTGDAKTGWSSSIHQFTLKNGYFPGGSGGVGMKKGEEIVYYAGTDIVYRSGKAGCSKWEYKGATWSRSEAKCGLKDHEGNPAFWTNLDDTEAMYRAEIDGEAVFSAAFTQTPPFRAANLAAAKAKASELQKAH